MCIVVPNSALGSFKNELTNKLKQPYSIYTAKEYKTEPNAHYNIFTYSKLDFLEEYLEANKGVPKILIVDEVHSIASTKSARGKLMRKFRPEFNCVFGATATPLLNDLKELYHIANFVVPGVFGTFKSFEDEYLIYKLKSIYRKGMRKAMKVKEYIGCKNLDKLSKHLETFCIIKRQEYNIQHHFKQVNLTAQEELDYEDCSKGVEKDYGDEQQLSARMHNLQRLVDGAYEPYEKPCLCSKEKLLVTVLKEILGRNESVLIYTEYNQTISRIERVLKACSKLLGYNTIKYITGDTKLEDRQALEREMPLKTIVIMSQAGYQSMNLQKANNIIIYDMPYSIGAYIQLIGRICRMDTTYDTQHIYYLEALNTIDTYKLYIVRNKMSMINALLGTDGNLPDIDLKGLDKMNRDYLKKKLLWRKER